MEFKDHFSQQAAAYRDFRPAYPGELFAYLARLSPAHDLAWDCATGNGQAATGLAPHFKKIIATDASASQVENAGQMENIVYRVATAENSHIDAGSVDLITVAQAFHWFDHEQFFAEAKKVLKKKGILAIWTYNLMRINAEIDALILEFYNGAIAPFWPQERCLVENDYRDIDFPFNSIKAPAFEMQTAWTYNQLIGYLGTWSAVQKFKEAKGRDPVLSISERFAAAWGNLNEAKTVIWPMPLHVGRFE